MNLVTLPVLLYLIPAAVLLTAVVPPKWKQTALALGGLGLISAVGGITALTLLLLLIFGAWFTLRVQPVRSGVHHHRADLWQYFGIGFQVLLLALGVFLLDDPVLMIPLALTVLQNTECIMSHADRHFSAPALLPFLCYSTELPRLFAGPVLTFPEYTKIWETRRITAETVGKGAGLCIRGLFQLVCLAMPMQSLSEELSAGTVLQTAADTWFALPVFYFTCYYGFKGAAQLGQGIAAMLGLSYPDSFRSPIFATSLQDFFRRFLISLSNWGERVLRISRAHDAGGYFVRTALILGGIGFLTGSHALGLLWGILTACILIAEYSFRKRIQDALPPPLRACLTALILLAGLGLLRCESFSEAVSFYTACIGVNGVPISGTVWYYMTANWVLLLICTVGLFPVRDGLKTLMQKSGMHLAAVPVWFFAALLELLMLLLSLSELLSRYLRS